jgi:hypothetical protein
MPKKRTKSKEAEDSQPQEKSQFDRAPRQKNLDRDPIKSAEQTREIPMKQGVIK